MSKATTDKMGLVTSQEVSLDKEYIEWLNELKIRFRSAQIKAAVKVNSEQLLFNWLLGRDLVIRKAEEKWESKRFFGEKPLVYEAMVQLLFGKY